jgi:hypothetical protein
MASAAILEVLATGDCSIGSWIDDNRGGSPKQAGLHALSRDGDLLSRQHKGNQDNLTVEARESFSSVHELFDLNSN